MKRFLLIAGLVLSPLTASGEGGAEVPATSDLGFLRGTWMIAADHYDVSNTNAPPRPESGTKTCEFKLESGGVPSFIVCENDSVYEGENESAYIEYINYNPYVKAFEKTNFFSGWPVKVIERVTFDAGKREVEVRGRVEVESNVDSYVEYWRFNEDYSEFEREAWMNRPFMPMTEYRLIVSGKGTRVVD